MRSAFRLMTLTEVFEAAKSETFRWTAARKAVVVEAVQQGRLSLGETAQRIGVSAEEIAGWRRQIERYGIGGLRATRLQIYEPERLKQRQSSASEDRACAGPIT